MGNWQEYISRDRELANRLITHAFSRNPNISSFPEFEDALLSPNPADDRIKHLSGVMDDFVVKELWEDEGCKARVRQNTNEEEFNQTYAISKSQQVVRQTPRRQDTMPNQFMVITVPKKVKTNGYERTLHGKKVSVNSYNRSFKGWTEKEVRFLRVRKQSGILTPKQIAWEFNNFYRGEERTDSSIKSKIFRL